MPWPDRVAATAVKVDAGTVTTSTLALGQTATAGNTLIVVIRRGSATHGTITVDDGAGAAGSSNSFTLDKNMVDTAPQDVSVYRLSNIPSGIANVRVTFDASVTMRFIVEEYTGNSALHGTPAAAQGASGGADSGAQTTTATCLLIGAAGTGNVGTWTAGSGWTLEDVIPAAANTKLGIEDRGAGAGVGGVASGTYNATFNSPNGSWAAILCAYTNAGGGAVQDTPELYGRPYGARGADQMQQLLAQ